MMNKDLEFIPQGNDDEFIPLPFFPWEVRPVTLAIDDDEAATAIHLAHGEIERAAGLLKVPLHRLTRLVRRSPRLQRILEESLEHTLIRARAVPIETLLDPEADNRRKEWAAAFVMKSRIAMGDPLSPAPAQATSLTVNNETRSFIVQWGDGTTIAKIGVDGGSRIDQGKTDDAQSSPDGDVEGQV
jgi:hypothetical protein